MTTTMVRSILSSRLILFLVFISSCRGYVARPSSTSIRPQTQSQPSPTVLFGGLFGGKGTSGGAPAETQEEQNASSNAPIQRVLEIPLSSAKAGGLRFALGLHLIGLQGDGTWRANEKSKTTLEMFFVRDGSAMFTIELGDDALSIDRYGRPSLAYVLQESLALHSVLDEIDTLAFGGEDIEEGNRLLTLAEEDGIDVARSKLPAKKA